MKDTKDTYHILESKFIEAMSHIECSFCPIADYCGQFDHDNMDLECEDIVERWLNSLEE